MLLSLPVLAAGPGLFSTAACRRRTCNVRWSRDNGGFFGDDFSVGMPGERWVIDGIRIWVVPGITETSNKHVGDVYQDVGGTEGALTPGSNETGNPKVRISHATGAGIPLYDDFGTFLRVFRWTSKG